MFSTFYFDRVTCLLVVQQTLQLMYNSSASIISKKKNRQITLSLYLNTREGSDNCCICNSTCSYFIE